MENKPKMIHYVNSHDGEFTTKAKQIKKQAEEKMPEFDHVIIQTSIKEGIEIIQPEVYTPELYTNEKKVL